MLHLIAVFFSVMFFLFIFRLVTGFCLGLLRYIGDSMDDWRYSRYKREQKRMARDGKWINNWKV